MAGSALRRQDAPSAVRRLAPSPNPEPSRMGASVCSRLHDQEAVPEAAWRACNRLSAETGRRRALCPYPAIQHLASVKLWCQT